MDLTKTLAFWLFTAALALAAWTLAAQWRTTPALPAPTADTAGSAMAEDLVREAEALGEAGHVQAAMVVALRAHMQAEGAAQTLRAAAAARRWSEAYAQVGLQDARVVEAEACNTLPAIDGALALGDGALDSCGMP